MNRAAAAFAALLFLGTGATAAAEDAEEVYRRAVTVLGEAIRESHRADGAALVARAAEMGLAAAQFHLATLYAEGTVLPLDKGRALEWFRRAAQQGHPAAQYAVGLAQMAAGDRRGAADWFRRAAEQGQTDARFQLALLLEKGDGVPQDEAEARRLYAQAAEQNDTASMMNLALMLDRGRGGPADLDAAIGWYVRAAGAQLPEAMHALCEILLDGRGVDSDPEKAAGWCHAAANRGHAPAQLLLATLYALGNGVAIDEVQAAAWLIIAARSGFPPAVKARDGLLPNLPPEIRTQAEALSGTLVPAN